MSDGIFILDEALLGCRFEQIVKRNEFGNNVECEPISAGILVGYERDFAGSTSFFFYDESKGSVSRHKVFSLDHYRIVEEDRHHLVSKLRQNLKFPKKKIRDVSREELIDLD